MRSWILLLCIVAVLLLPLATSAGVRGCAGGACSPARGVVVVTPFDPGVVAPMPDPNVGRPVAFPRVHRVLRVATAPVRFAGHAMKRVGHRLKHRVQAVRARVRSRR